MCRNDFLKIHGHASLLERGISLYSFDNINSTNSFARELFASGEGKAPALVVADSQSEGKGRMGRSFYSPSGTGIYMTLVLDVTDCDARSTVKITSASAVAVSRAIERITGKRVGIKWVNDLYLDQKKVCGILAESFVADGKRYVMVGVGINLSTKCFPTELSGIAGSLEASVEKEVRRELVLAACCEILDTYTALCGGDVSYMGEYRERSVVIGRRIRFMSGERTGEGVAVSIDDSGALKVLCDGGVEISLCSGEITIRLSEVDK